MNMRIRDESEYCIGITRDEVKQSSTMVSEWTITNAPHQAYRPGSHKPSHKVTANQSSVNTASSYSDRTKNIFVPDIANSSADMFAAAKKVYGQKMLSGTGSYRLAKRHLEFKSQMFNS